MTSWRHVLIKACQDSAYRDRLKANPTAAAAEAGVKAPAGISVEVIEQGQDDLHLVLGSRCGVAELDQVLARAESDAAFRQQLQSDGRATVESAIGQRLPPQTNVRVHEAAPNRVRLFLPAEQEAEGELSDHELSEHELEAVAGGTLRSLLTRIGNAVCRDSTTESYPGYTGGFISNITVTTDNSVSNTVTQY